MILFSQKNGSSATTHQSNPCYIHHFPPKSSLKAQMMSLGVNFINVFCALYSYESLFWQLFLVTLWLWQKIRMKTLIKLTVGVSKSILFHIF